MQSMTIRPGSARIDATSIGCNLNQVKPLGSPGFVAITIFDTLVFVAISAKVLKINSEWRFPGKSWIASFIHGDGLSHLSKVLLRSGQFYYLTTVGFNVFTLITLLSSNSTFSPTFRAGSTFVSLGLQNMMTCKVFRLLRLGVIQNDLSTGQCQSIEFASNELE
ncbi:hypothetical protein QCA50_002520 [Cerrena zonata]|uniref:Uncharacterized protein n=1 Tax=Cerrena zonata TaxID=2478898 RepID=A0AAW0GVQ3_9APHY